MTKILNFALILILIFHVWIAANFELAHDEAYYWLYSNHLDWGFFDHPPAVGIIIRLFSFLPHSEVAVRLGFIILQLLSCFLLMSSVPKKRQIVTACLFFSFPLASFSGLLALPDLPLLLMTTVYCVFLKRYLETEDRISILGLTLTIPMLLYSKYHGILVIFFTVLALPKLFQKKSFYLIALLSIMALLPHLRWQYTHDFSTLRYHFLERPRADFSIKRLLEYTLIQVFLAGLFAGPVVWWIALREKAQSEFERALKFVSVGSVAFFFLSTVTKKFEANWTIFLAAPLIMLVASSKLWERKGARAALFVSFGIVMLARILFVFDPSAVKIKRLKEFHGWSEWAKTLEAQCRHPIMANTYQMASKLSFYLEKPIHALNYRSRKNQFDYWPRANSYYPSDEVCYISDRRELGGVELESPEGKSQFLIQGLKLSELKAHSP